MNTTEKAAKAPVEMTAIPRGSTGQNRTRIQHDRVLSQRVESITEAVALLRTVHDPKYGMGQLMRTAEMTFAGNLDKVASIARAVEREALIDAPTAEWLGRMRPMLVEVQELTTKPIKRVSGTWPGSISTVRNVARLEAERLRLGMSA